MIFLYKRHKGIGLASQSHLILVYEQEVHDYLKSLCPSLHITRGEYDEDSRYPETKTLTIGQFKLGLCHGHQVSDHFVINLERERERGVMMHVII